MTLPWLNKNFFFTSFLFFKHMFMAIKIVWPVLSVLILIIAAAGLWIGHLEGWDALDAIYFSCVTAMTIGYGDLTPTHPLSKVLAIVIGLDGFLVTGITIAVAVKALQGTLAVTEQLPPDMPQDKGSLPRDRPPRSSKRR